MTEDRTAKMIDRVQKLLNKAERAGTPEEAETFFAKAHQLMEEHNIEMTMLRLAGEVEADEIIQMDMDVNRSGFFKPMVQLAREVAWANDVRCLVKNPGDWGKDAGVRFVGHKTDINNVRMLYTALLAHCVKERRNVPEYVKEQQASKLVPNAVGKWRVDFSMGYALRIGRRLEAQREEMRRAAGRADSTGTLLPALIDKGTAVDAYMASNVRTSAARANRSKYDPAAMSAGAAAANRANLGGTSEVGGTSRTALGR